MEILCTLCNQIPLNEKKEPGNFLSGDAGIVCYACFNKTPARRMPARNSEELEKAIVYAIKFTLSKRKK